MRTGGLFRRNTVSSKRDDDFGDYATVISAEDDPRKLKDYITSLYKAFKDKSKGLRSAYSKLDLLNNEINQEKTRFADIEDENRSLREQMQAMADQLAAKEEEFNKWQGKLVEQTRRERETFVEEMDVERDHFKERINQLEDALNLANLEISRLTIELADLNDLQKKGRRGSSSTSGSRSSMEITFGEKKKDDRNELTRQILEITQRRMSLQTELTLLEETNEELKVNWVPSIKDHIRNFYENQMLRRENDNLKKQLGKQLFVKSLEDINLTD